ncbi:MAG TPA: enoyl-CoA hydratase/isomerase family protein [Pseudonocardia sp.]|jgi:enoyl-CoA hydratase/carnithine racemase|nr:enoyl-CoA hydratase/isomerase family protein [Pseudonocardia sp.]
MSMVKFDVDGQLGLLTVDNPPLNLMSQGVIDGFEEAVNQASVADIRALLVRAEGSHFMGGADVHIFDGKTAAQARSMFARSLPVFARLEELPFPTVTAVQGLCLAAGLEVALSTDIVVAGESAKFAQVERHIGTSTLLGGAQRLAERAGSARARQIVFDGDQYSAQQFADWNIINHVVPDAELGAFAEKLARRYAAGPTRAFAAGKALIRGYLDGDMRAADRAVLESAAPLFDTEDMQTGVKTLLTLGGRNFLGKAEFKGR